jgi:hypothetical protein
MQDRIEIRTFFELIFLTQKQIACNSHVIFTREREEWSTLGRDPGPNLFRFRPEVGRRLGDLLIHSLDVSINNIHPTTPSLDLINGVFCFLFFQLCEIEGEFFPKVAKLVEFTLQKTILQKHSQLFILSLK